MRLSLVLERWVLRLGAALAWVVVLALVFTSGIDVLGRQIYQVGTETINTVMASLFLSLAMLFLGYAYLRNAHVRIDIIREKMPQRLRVWIELFGNLVVLLPVCIIIIHYGGVETFSDLRQGETLEIFGGLPLMWLVEAVIPAGFFFLLLADIISIAIRNVLFLCGRLSVPAPLGDEEN